MRPVSPTLAKPEGGAKVWPVGSLLRAIADSLEARFNPVTVQGELSSFSRAAIRLHRTLSTPLKRLRDLTVDPLSLELLPLSDAVVDSSTFLLMDSP